MSDFFDDESDPFDSIFQEFFGRGRGGIKRNFVRGEGEERVIDLLEEGKKIYLIFEVPGYEEEDLQINIKGRVLEITIKKKDTEGIKEYLAQKLSTGIRMSRNLPESINTKDYDYTIKNGVLEIVFNKK